MDKTIPIFEDENGKIFLSDTLPNVADEIFKSILELSKSKEPIIGDVPEKDAVLKQIGVVSISAASAETTFKATIEVDGNTQSQQPELIPSEDGWAIQTLVFHKKEIVAKKNVEEWMSARPLFGQEFEVVDTAKSWIVKQHDADLFSEFKMVTIDKGVSAAYGKMSNSDSTDEHKGKMEKAAAETIIDCETLHNIGTIFAEKFGVVSSVAKAEAAQDASQEIDAVQEERFVLSLVLEPTIEADGTMSPDTQGDVYSAEEIRKAAHWWMENGGLLDLQHNWKPLAGDQVRVLETYLAPVEFNLGDGDKSATIKKGSWLLGIRVLDDDLWEQIKQGSFGAYSIGGEGLRVPIE